MLLDGTGEMAGSGSWFWHQWLLFSRLELFWTTSYSAILYKNVILTYTLGNDKISSLSAEAAVPHIF